MTTSVGELLSLLVLLAGRRTTLDLIADGAFALELESHRTYLKLKESCTNFKFLRKCYLIVSFFLVDLIFTSPQTPFFTLLRRLSPIDLIFLRFFVLQQAASLAVGELGGGTAAAGARERSEYFSGDCVLPESDSSSTNSFGLDLAIFYNPNMSQVDFEFPGKIKCGVCRRQHLENLSVSGKHGDQI